MPTKLMVSMEASIHSARVAVVLRSLLAVGVILGTTGRVEAASADSCDANVVIPKLSFAASSLTCQQVWSRYDYNLRYAFDKRTNTVSILLSAAQTNNWIGIGFSPDGGMIGSSAMVGYLETNGTGILRQYYLKGKSSSLVIPNQGDLHLVPGSELVAVQNQTTYLAFQVHMNYSSVTSSKLVLAFGYNGILPDPTTDELQQHLDRLQITVDFTTGMVSNPDKLRRNHGIINIFGWAVLAPIGAIISRYFRQWDPIWFYLHVGLQCSSFIFGVAGVAMGVQLTKDLPSVNVHSHRLLGIFVLLLGTLQVLALCARPHKESKIRKYWNWYHHIIGRFVLLLAAINIIVGINLAGAGHSWKVGYAVLLVITVTSVIVLESLYWFKWYKQSPAPVLQRETFSRFNEI